MLPPTTPSEVEEQEEIVETIPEQPEIIEEEIPAEDLGPPLEEPVIVRAGIHWDQTRSAIETTREWTVTPSPKQPPRKVRGGELRARALNGATVRLETEAGQLLAEGSGPIRLSPGKDAYFTVDDRRYRGDLELTARDDSLFIVNVLPLEDYLRGVLPGEIGRRAAEEREAVSAQAVAARTYVVKKLGQYTALPFDVFSSVQDQVYEGVDGENPVADAALQKTEGLVLADRAGLLDAYYCSTCGGRTSDIAVVWPHKEAVPSLRGVLDGEGSHAWCRQSPHFEWTEFWSGDRLSDLVRRHLPEQEGFRGTQVEGPLTDLQVHMDEESGRVREIVYRWKGGSATIPGDRNRWILRRPDNSILRSVRLDIDVEKQGDLVTRVVARGNGNGHGVGMCQMGAIARARSGEGFRRILEAYYPGAQIRSLRGNDLPPGERS
jgi:stage II sporulation protein D